MEIIGKIEWMPPAPTEFPKNSGEFNIGIKVKGEFYNLHKSIEKLNKMLKMLKVGYEVKLDVEGNKIQNIEVTNDKVTEPEKKGNWTDDMTNFKELLDDAHTKFKGGFEIRTDMLSVDYEKNRAMFKAMVVIPQFEINAEDGKTNRINMVFTGHGDAEGIESKMIKPHFIRMAETRAIARALRFATNNAKVSEEETSVSAD